MDIKRFFFLSERKKKLDFYLVLRFGCVFVVQLCWKVGIFEKDVSFFAFSFVPKQY